MKVFGFIVVGFGPNAMGSNGLAENYGITNIMKKGEIPEVKLL
jgi:hypothetical protein